MGGGGGPGGEERTAGAESVDVDSVGGVVESGGASEIHDGGFGGAVGGFWLGVGGELVRSEWGGGGKRRLIGVGGVFFLFFKYERFHCIWEF